MRSGNPVLKNSVFEGVRFKGRDGEAVAVNEGVMTMNGVMAKTAVLLLAVIAAAAFTWQKAAADGAAVMPWFIGGLIGSFVLALVISFKPRLAPALAVPHALLEGLFLGAISAFYASRFDGMGGLAGGIVFQAVLATFGVTLAMLGLYAFRIIRVTQKFRSIVMAMTGGLMLFYLIGFVLRMFGVGMPMLHEMGALALPLMLLATGLAAFNLLLDFDLIERGVAGRAPKYMEWFGGFALIVTLVWLYIELLRLLSYLASSND